MPEGHLLHRIARDHGRLFTGQPLRVTSPQGRFAAEAGLVDGMGLVRVEAVGKHLFYHWGGSATGEETLLVHVHLGLYGKFRLHRLERDDPPPAPRGEVRLRVEGAKVAFDLNGPNRCELIDRDAYLAIKGRLGPDPLDPHADPMLAWRRIAKSRSPIGALLMNQSVIAGVGNIYRSEVLHLLRIDPHRSGRDLTEDGFDALWRRLVELMGVGARLGRIVVADPDTLGKPRSRMSRHERLCVYKKENCSGCGGVIQSWSLAGRSVYACLTCQT